MDQKCRGKRNVVRNEKWLRDMYRELRIRASVSTSGICCSAPVETDGHPCVETPGVWPA